MNSVSFIDALLKQPPYRSSPQQNNELFASALRESIIHHCANCAPFARWYRKKADPDAAIDDLSKVPFMPVTNFKRFNLQSTTSDNIVRVLKSSATSSQTPSTVALDSTTRDRQTRTLAMLMSELIGPARRPFIVLDAAPTAASDVELSARVAGMRGYLMIATEVHYAMRTVEGVPTLDVEEFQRLLRSLCAASQPVCLIGYTYMLYQYVVKPLSAQGLSLELPPGSQVLHFGGWKRLEHLAVERGTFNADVRRVFAFDDLIVRDIYGFTEQLGIIYPDDGNGVRVAPVYSEVFVRDPFSLKPVTDGQTGLLQFLTPLPYSYPGVSVLLDDLGRIVARDQGVDGRYGTHFEVLGRAKGSEIRGCGDTMPERVYEVNP